MYPPNVEKEDILYIGRRYSMVLNKFKIDTDRRTSIGSFSVEKKRMEKLTIEKSIEQIKMQFPYIINSFMKGNDMYNSELRSKAKSALKIHAIYWIDSDARNYIDFRVLYSISTENIAALKKGAYDKIVPEDSQEDFWQNIIATLTENTPTIAKKKTDSTKTASAKNATTTTSTTAAATTTTPAQNLNPLQGKRITVPEPVFQFGTASENWIPVAVQGQVTSALKKYSGLDVIDRQNIDKAIKEQKLSTTAAYSEEQQLEIGNLLAANYIVVVNIIKKGAGYSVDAKINNAETGQTQGAPYNNPNCPLSKIESGIEINNLCYELLKGLGVPESSLAELKDTKKIEEQQKEVQAENDLAKGLAIYKQGGSIVDSMLYLQKAQNANTEAAQRYKNISSSLAAGDIRGQVMNEIQLRKEWIKIWADFDRAFEKDPYLLFWEGDVEMDKIDFEKNLVTLKVKVGLSLNPEMVKLFDNLLTKFKSIKQTSPWNVASKFAYSFKSNTNFPWNLDHYGVFIDGYLYDNNGKLLSTVLKSNYNYRNYKNEGQLLTCYGSYSIRETYYNKYDKEYSCAEDTLYFTFNADNMPADNKYVVKFKASEAIENVLSYSGGIQVLPSIENCKQGKVLNGEFHHIVEGGVKSALGKLTDYKMSINYEKN